MTALVSLAVAACAVYTVSNRTASVSVDDAGRLVSLRNRATGTEWSGGGDLWRLYYDRRTADGSFEEREIVVTAEGQSPSVTCDGSRIVIRYDRLDAGVPRAFALTLTVTAEESGLVRFASELTNGEPDTCIREFHYPLVGNLRLPEAAELFTTEHGGRRWRDPLAAITHPGVSPPYMGPDQLYRQKPLKYPNMTSNCFAFWTEREGLYFGSHDPAFQETWHVVRAWPDAAGAFTRVEAGFGKYPNAVCGDTWRCAANVVAPYAGGWSETAKIYRRWADTWWNRRPTPRWIREMTGWQRLIFRHQYGRTFFSPEDLTGRIADAGRSVDVNAVFCFGWWRSGMDNGYPDSYRVTDSDAAWRKAIADCRAAGGRFIQYFNGKLIDVESDFYRKGPGARIAMKDNVGEPVTEQYKFTSSGTFTGQYNTRTFAVARQDAPEWRTVLSNCVRQAISFGADSVFFDQLGSLDRHPDWTHRGGFAIPVLDGFRKKAETLRLMRDLIAAEAPQDFGLGTEFFTDVCMQYVDFVHNWSGGTRPESFMDWTRYAFPEVVLSDREIRDDAADVEWRINHNLLIGLRSDIEIWRCRGLVSETPRYRAALARVNALRRAHPVTLTGAFRGTDGLANSNPGSLLANVFVDGDRAAVVVTSRTDASGTIALAGWSPQGSIPVDVRPGEAKVLDFTR